MDVRRLWIQTACTGLVFSLVCAGAASADPPSLEFWPEIDTWLRLSPAWRVSLFVPVSENLDTHYREGNLIPQVDYAFGKARFQGRFMDEDRSRDSKLFLLRGGYLGGKSLDDEGEAYTEYQTFGELHWRIPVKGGFAARRPPLAGQGHPRILEPLALPRDAGEGVQGRPRLTRSLRERRSLLRLAVRHGEPLPVDRGRLVVVVAAHRAGNQRHLSVRLALVDERDPRAERDPAPVL
jgi:hypothetical protein